MSLCQFLLVIVINLGVVVLGQEVHQEEGCFGAGSIAIAVALSAFLTLVLLYVIFYLWGRFRKQGDANHLVLETDPERGQDKYAFDNPGFKEPILSATPTPIRNPSTSPNKGKWKQWSPLSSLILTKNEKVKASDDSALQGVQTKNVTLRSYDFTGLGFTVCGNMKNGIFIKDVLQRGPAQESGQIFSGDKIKNMTISFDHMVYEDAVAILSYASPYEVSLQIESKKANQGSLTGESIRLEHPLYKSISSCDLTKGKRNTIENGKIGKVFTSNLQQVKKELEKKIFSEKSEVQKTENKYQKFGIKVLPVDINDTLQIHPQISPKTSELSQNDNNINLEIHSNDNGSEKQSEDIKEQEFVRYNSGIKRDKDGIPQEIPKYMMEAAVAARNNRKNSKEEEVKSPKKVKGRAPAPPADTKLMEQPAVEYDMVDAPENLNKSILSIKSVDGYNSDSDNQSSVNTIELNSSDITVHQVEENEEKMNRKTHSTGDLTNIKSTTSTLERAKSLDITDTTLPMLELESDKNLAASTEDSFAINLEGQKSRLKKATEWGNLEDAILNFKIDGFNTEDSLTSDLEEFQNNLHVEEADNTIVHRIQIADSNELKSKLDMFLQSEKESSSFDGFYQDPDKISDLNVSDDMKVSRHSRFDGIEQPTSLNSIKNISSVTIGEVDFKPDVTINVTNSNLDSELYTTAMEETVRISDSNGIELKSPIEEPTSLTIDINSSNSSKSSFSPTYITEIKVLTPEKTLDNDFDNYVKTFEATSDDFDSTPLTKENEKPNVENELYKIHEIVEEQFKTLPEMKFSTNYENPNAEAKSLPERPLSHIEQLRCNFEKPRVQKVEPIKSRIPVSRTGKTPPTSPERRDSKNLDMEVNREIVEMMNSVIHSTPKPKIAHKNVSVTSIRTNSKIPSSIPYRVRKIENSQEFNGNGTSTETSFKHWVFASTEGSKQES